MPIEIDERWEYWVGNDEVEELFRENSEAIVRAHKKCSQSPFHFLFGGDESMESGRFFDGIKFGVSHMKPWFVWNTSNKPINTIVGLFEEHVRSVSRQNRYDFLVKTFCSAWDKLPGAELDILERLIAWIPPEREPGKPGAPPSPLGCISLDVGMNYSTVRRHYLSVKHAFMLEALPYEVRPKCACGCGGVVGIGITTDTIWNRKAGGPATFIQGHNASLKKRQRLEKTIAKVEASQANSPLVLSNGHLPDTIAPFVKEVAAVARCKYCNGRHVGICPSVRRIEYHENGQIKSVEFHGKSGLPGGVS